jgi:leader peptidase (prepilin peptidase)/N-methyltransferase
MTALAYAVATLFGLALGSFLNVAIYRVPRGLSVVRPSSACPACDASIKPRDNIPVVSFVSLRGRCRSCGAAISLRYPLVEAATAALGVGAVLRFGASDAAAFVGLGGAVLIAIAMIDLEHRRVPNVIVLPATAAAAVWVLVIAAITGHWRLAASALGSGAAGFVLLFVIALVSGGMGMGDVKLAAFIGVFTGRFGWEVAVLGLFAGFLLGGVVAGGLLVAGRRGRKDALPFAPALAAGAIIAVFWGTGPVRAWLGLS